MLVELDGIWARQMAALALGGHSSMYMEASETPLLWVCCEKQNGGRILVLRLLGLPGATCIKRQFSGRGTSTHAALCDTAFACICS